MSRGYQALDLDGSAIRALMDGAQSVEEYKRYQSLHLRVNEGLSVAEIARATGLAVSTIRNLHSRCRQGGLEAARTLGKGGRYRSYLAAEEEEAFLASFAPQAGIGGILDVGKVHRALEKKVGGKVARFTTYRMLHRHGWRKIAPRPRHPKADPVAQEAFKKTGALSSRKAKKKPISRASR